MNQGKQRDWLVAYGCCRLHPAEARSSMIGPVPAAAGDLSFLPPPPLFFFFFFFFFFLSFPFFSRHCHCGGGTAGQGGQPNPTGCLLGTDRGRSLGLGLGEPAGTPPGLNQHTGAGLAPVHRRANWWPFPQLPSHSLRRSGCPARPHGLGMAVHRPAVDRLRVTRTLPILYLPLYFSLILSRCGNGRRGALTSDRMAW